MRREAKRIVKAKARIPTFIDLFAGAGGLTEGFKLAGFRCLFATDFDAYCAATHKLNHPDVPFYDKPIETLSSRKLTGFLRTGTEIDLVIGGPPCQGFSVNAPVRQSNDPRNHLFTHFVRTVKILQPRFIVFENVPGLISLDGGRVVDAIYDAFYRVGYGLKHRILFAAHYGIPQERWRLFFIGTRMPRTEIRFPYPTHYADGVANFTGGKELTFAAKPRTLFEQLQRFVSVRDALSDLPPLANAEGSEEAEYDRKPLTEYQRQIRGECGTLWHHVAPRLATVNLERMKHIPPGGSWRDIPYDLLPVGMKRARRSDHTKRYGRLHPDRLSCTIMTKCDPHWGSYFHWEQERVVTVREAARIQSFPDSYRFVGPQVRQYVQVGNAVPPLLAKAVAMEIKASMNETTVEEAAYSPKAIAASMPS
jgi:DNA (cytosine-5)-methyltransferase 1